MTKQSGVISPDLPGSVSSIIIEPPSSRSGSTGTKRKGVPDLHSQYKSDPMMTEHLALIGFATRLGTSITSDAAEASLTRNDAQLLMSLLHPSVTSSSAAARDSLHLSNEPNDTAPRKTNVHKEVNGILNNDSSSFAFSCPSLSIDANQRRAKRTMTTDRLALLADDDTDGKSSVPPAPRPAQLLGRTIVTTTRDGVSEATEVLARNVMQAFAVALEWRYSVWVTSLAKVLQLKKSLMAEHLAALKSEQGIQRPGKAKKQHEEEKKETGDNGDVDDEEEEDEDGAYEYAEAHAIDSLARAISEVSVVDVKTTFRVLHQEDKELIQPPKRLKVRQVTLEGTNSQNGGIYQRSSPLSFEAALTVLSGNDEKTIVIETSGSIIGTFSPSTTTNAGDGEEVLSRVDIKLDTEALAQSMEEQSRILIRGATENAMGPTPEILDLTQPEEPDVVEYSPASAPRTFVSASTQPYPPTAVITPKQGNSPSSPFSSAGGPNQEMEDLTIPLPSVPYLNRAVGGEITPMASPKRRASRQGGRPSVTEQSNPASDYLFSPKQTVDATHLPKLVSPSPVQHRDVGSDAEGSRGPRAEESEWYTYRGSDDEAEEGKPQGPKLPALVEVACAAIASTGKA